MLVSAGPSDASNFPAPSPPRLGRCAGRRPGRAPPSARLGRRPRPCAVPCRRRPRWRHRPQHQPSAHEVSQIFHGFSMGFQGFSLRFLWKNAWNRDLNSWTTLNCLGLEELIRRVLNGWTVDEHLGGAVDDHLWRNIKVYLFDPLVDDQNMCLNYSCICLV